MLHAARMLLQVAVWHHQDMVACETFAAHHVIVGRDPTYADLTIAAPGISREHALVEHDGQHVVVHDLDSTNGMFIQGIQVARAQVDPDDRVQLGEYFLSLALVSATNVAQPREASTTTGLYHSVSEELEGVPRAETTAVTQVFGITTPELLLPQTDATARDALLVPLPAAVAQVLPLPQARVPTAPVAMALLKIGQTLEDYTLLRPGRRFQLPKTHQRADRYADPISQPSPLQVQWRGPHTVQACVPAGSAWLARSQVGVWDEPTGVRENRVRRRRDHVWITLAPTDILRVQVGPTAYVLGFVPLPTALPRAARRVAHGRASWRHRLAGCAASCAALALLAVAVWAGGAVIRSGHPPALLPPWRHAPIVVDAALIPTPPSRSPSAASATTSDLHSTQWPAPSAGRGQVVVPGGSRGYRVFGLIMPELLEDPGALPTGDVHLAPDKALLRGTQHDLAKVLSSVVGGPPWLLRCEARDIQGTDARLSAARLAQWLMQHPEPWLACQDKTLGQAPHQTVRQTVSLSLAASGRVRSIRPVGDTNPAWVRCVNAAKNSLRPPRFAGRDLAVRVSLTLLPWQ